MHSLENYSPLRSKPYSAKNIVKPIPFCFVAPQARAVHLAGDFNDWHPDAHPMRRQVDGAWRLEIPLSHGHHHYIFLVDGKPTLDPRAQGIARDHKGDKVSLIAVS